MTVQYVEDEKVAQIGTSDLLRQVLGDLTDTLVVCVGDCGRQLLISTQWRRFDKAKQKRLKELNVTGEESKHRCCTCRKAGFEGKSREVGIGQRKVTREDLPEVWERIRANGGSMKELAAHYGVTRERARQIVNEMGLTKSPNQVERQEIFLEELEHLTSCGAGVAAIARALQMEPDALVSRVDRLYREGLTAVRFETYRRRYNIDPQELEAA